jgi:hypothetical protein
VKLKKILTNFVFPVVLTAVVFLIVKKLFLKKELIHYIGTLTVREHFISSIFMLIGFAFAGLQLRNVFIKSISVKLSWFDTLTLPITQNLWGYIIPFQGSFLYSTFFLKTKYKINIKSSFSVYFIIILASLFLGGITGLIYLLANNGSFKQGLFFIFFIALPVFPFLGKRFLISLNFLNESKLFKFQQYFLNIIEEVVALLNNKLFLINLFIIDICYVVTYATWSFWISEVLEYGIPFTFFLSLGFLMKLHSFTKLTPGNMGIIQLLVGGYFSLFDLNPEIGVVVSLIQLITTFFFGFPIGLITTILSFNNLKSDVFTNFFKKI